VNTLTVVTPEQVLDLIKKRRSIRKFLPDPIPEPDLDTIMDAATWAPSGTNFQNWRFIVVRSPELKHQMRAAVEQQIEEYAAQIPSARGKKEFVAYSRYYLFFTDAPAVVAVVMTPYESLVHRIMERYELGNHATETVGIQGPSAAIQNILLMAHALGYGSCWMTGPLIARPALEKLLGIQAPDELLAMVPLGKPVAARNAPARKPLHTVRDYR
jgi:nitroreductase